MVLDGKFLQEYPVNAGAIGVKMDGLFLKEKLLLRCWDSLSLLS